MLFTCLLYLVNMLSSEKINAYLSLFKELRPGDVFTLLRAARLRKLAAGEVYIKEGTMGEQLGYIKKGLIRVYQVTEKGEDITLMLRWEDQFIASHDNIFFQKPSRFIYQALEDTLVLEAKYSTIQSILSDNPAFQQPRYYFVMHMLAQSMVRVESFVLLNPEERYLQLIREKPDLVQRVPDKYLATLLGITPVSLSRIRKRIVQKQQR